jgi:site-specific DNA-methyltransferase (adenine-specific)
MTVRVITGDGRDVLPTLGEASVDACVTDPPYGLAFMGKNWDHGVPGATFWTAVARVLKPGAHLLAFGGTRTFHRLTCAIEDAGFEIRDCIMWVYGSGFPKSHNGPWGGTALKPAWEPIIVARKPPQGTVAANVEKHGTGALNIDECRIETEEARPERDARNFRNLSSNGIYGDGLNGSRATGETTLGRWPANLIHDGSEEVLAAFPDAPGQQGDVKGTEPSAPAKNTYGTYGRSPAPNLRGDSGSAARFFYCAKADRADRDDGLGHRGKRPLLWSSGEQSPGTFQSANTDRSAHNRHPTVKPTDLMRYLCRLVTPLGGTILDPFAGSGSTGRGAVAEGFNFIGIELEAEYAEIAEARIRAVAPLFAEVST